MSELEDLLELLKKIPNLPIVKRTQCTALQHIWFYTSGCSTDEPSEEAKCDCGMYSYKMAKMQREITEA